MLSISRLRRLCLCPALIVAAASASLFSGCNTLEGQVAAGAWGATALVAQSPAHEVEQIHYIGVFDPHEQVPPSVYRVRVRGQASFMSRTNFASGWVQASLVDSLGTNMSFNNDTGSWNVSKIEERETAKLKTGRRQMLFGPYGFREQPADHRLCIVMGANPDEWFHAMDQALGVVADAVSEKRVGELKSDVFDQIITAKQEQAALDGMLKGISPTAKNETPPAAATTPAPAPAPADPPAAGGSADATAIKEASEKAAEARLKAEEAKNAAVAAKGAAEVARLAAEAAEKEATRQAAAAEQSRGEVTSNINKFHEKCPDCK